MTNDLGPGFCGTCGDTFTTTAALNAHQAETGHEMDQPDHPLHEEPVMLNPVTAWTPGLLVDYHGSLTRLHGLYEAYPCTCLNCVDRLGLPGVRFELRDDNGTVVVACVRPASITPADIVDEPEHEECLGIHNGADGYRDCDGNPI